MASLDRVVQAASALSCSVTAGEDFVAVVPPRGMKFVDGFHKLVESWGDDGEHANATFARQRILERLVMARVVPCTLVKCGVCAGTEGDPETTGDAIETRVEDD